ncbi:c-type cytochrome [Natronospira bacteriovora]|uniref:Cytochrome c n=1 Tax=Natronospira bacteriovora TaxID=3069753 RepID=A0ABU0W714_9GAMM|nr:cytochrome c [Natronospira sp. AB-CW4]MDQ2068790.1 cytochrome c [Natronospira sp. AB-CW4]
MSRGLLILAALLAGLAGLGSFLFLAGDRESPAGDGASVPSGHEVGFELYQANCMACHGGEGQGRRGHFPPLADHVPEMLGRDGGRAYLIDVILFGVTGETQVQGITYDGYMPGMPQLADQDIARILNYLAHAWGNDNELSAGFEPYAAKEIAERRADEKTPGKVGESQPR